MLTKSAFPMFRRQIPIQLHQSVAACAARQYHSFGNQQTNQQQNNSSSTFDYKKYAKKIALLCAGTKVACEGTKRIVDHLGEQHAKNMELKDTVTGALTQAIRTKNWKQLDQILSEPISEAFDLSNRINSETKKSRRFIKNIQSLPSSFYYVGKCLYNVIKAAVIANQLESGQASLRIDTYVDRCLHPAETPKNAGLFVGRATVHGDPEVLQFYLAKIHGNEKEKICTDALASWYIFNRKKEDLTQIDSDTINLLFNAGANPKKIDSPFGHLSQDFITLIDQSTDDMLKRKMHRIIENTTGKEA